MSKELKKYIISISDFYHCHDIELTSDFVLDEIIKETVKDNYKDCFIIVSLYAEGRLRDVALAISKIGQYGFGRTLILSDNVHKGFLEKIISGNTEVLYVEGFLFESDHLYTLYSPNDTWNANTNKGLAAFGYLYEWRLKVLYKLYKEKLLDNSLIFQYSQNLQPPTTFRIDDWHEFANFCSQHRTHFPNSDSFNQELSVFGGHGRLQSNYSSCGLLRQIYADTSFSILVESESCLDEIVNDQWITEKTYRIFYNCHPFIAVADNNFLWYLNSLGYKTFNNFLSTNYDEYLGYENRSEIIAELTKEFITVVNSKKSLIFEDIIHNKQQVKTNLNTYKKQGLQKFNLQEQDWLSFSQELNLSKEEFIINIESIAAKVAQIKSKYAYEIQVREQTSKQRFWISWYNAIKSEHWPRLTNNEEFVTLSKEIREECKNKFNFSDDVETFVDVFNLVIWENV